MPQRRTIISNSQPNAAAVRGALWSHLTSISCRTPRMMIEAATRRYVDYVGSRGLCSRRTARDIAPGGARAQCRASRAQSQLVRGRRTVVASRIQSAFHHSERAFDPFMVMAMRTLRERTGKAPLGSVAARGCYSVVIDPKHAQKSLKIDVGNVCQTDLAVFHVFGVNTCSQFACRANPATFAPQICLIHLLPTSQGVG